MESRECDVSVEVVRVKQEPDWEQSEEYEEQSAEDEAQAPINSFAGYEEKPVCVKEEPSSSDDGGSGNESALYADLKVKEELVPGPEEGQSPGVPGADSAETPVSVKEEPPASDDAGSCSTSAELQSDQHVKEITLTPVFMMQPGMVYVLNGSNQAVKPESNDNTGDKSFPCDRCNKTFKWARHLKRHIGQHNKQLRRLPAGKAPKDKTKPFYCVICKRQFSQLFKFTVHLQQHATEIPYSCGLCNKVFARHSSLVKHDQTHRNMSHGCGMCNERFFHKVELIRHKLSHTCVNPVCGCDNHSKQFYQNTHKRINILRR